MKSENHTENTAGSDCSGATCYALRLFTYDYNEWQEDFAVSFDPELLKTHFAGLDHLYDDEPLVDVSEHETHSERQDVHWVITPILFLHNSKAQERGSVS
jgi:hypothetical protein